MAWTTMHFAVGMGCAGAIGTVACLVARRGWRWVPAVMTLGGVWALVPDMTRIFREDVHIGFLTATLGSRTLDRWLNAMGDVFFFHRALDSQPNEYALHGLTIILVLYNLSVVAYLWQQYRQRNSLAERAWRAHAPFIGHSSAPLASLKPDDTSELADTGTDPAPQRRLRRMSPLD